jgi:hypothetical protein
MMSDTNLLGVRAVAAITAVQAIGSRLFMCSGANGFGLACACVPAKCLFVWDPECSPALLRATDGGC